MEVLISGSFSLKRVLVAALTAVKNIPTIRIGPEAVQTYRLLELIRLVKLIGGIGRSHRNKVGCLRATRT